MPSYVVEIGLNGEVEMEVAADDEAGAFDEASRKIEEGYDLPGGISLTVVSIEESSEVVD